MPSRAATSAPTEMEVGILQRNMPGLQFKEDLSWRAGKPIAIADLLRRLQALHKEMRDMEQEENERESFTKVAKDLASPNLLAHKDKGVKAWTACCLVDLLRLCAPDAPYTGQQLKVSSYAEKNGVVGIVADNFPGHIQHAHYRGPPGAFRPFECLQSAASVRADVSVASQEYCPAYRYTIFGAIDDKPLHHIL